MLVLDVPPNVDLWKASPSSGSGSGSGSSPKGKLCATTVTCILLTLRSVKDL